MKNRAEFDLKKSLYGRNSVFISRILDPYTAKIAKFVYNLGLTANNVTLISFLLGMSSIASLFIWRDYDGIIIASILLTLRNIGDTIDGKIARGSGNPTSVGGFSDIIVDWIFFHAAFFVAIGILTDNLLVGFLCVTGYMSREFTRRKFTEKYGVKITETDESKKIPKIVSLIRIYDLGSVFWIIPFVLLINQPVWIIYFIAFAEYSLLLGELIFDYRCFLKKEEKKETIQPKE
jgi:phosphatidylglycerophosphate synthase